MKQMQPRTLTERLAELARTDPAVARAEAHLIEVTSEYQCWRRQMVRAVWGS